MSQSKLENFGLTENNIILHHKKILHYTKRLIEKIDELYESYNNYCGYHGYNKSGVVIRIKRATDDYKQNIENLKPKESKQSTLYNRP